MLVNTNITTVLAASIDASQTVIELKSAGMLSSLLVSPNYGYIEISDGINKEVVKATAISGNMLTVERAVPSYAFIKGACAATDSGFKTMCALISQGGCTPTAVCTPVSRGTIVLPDAVIGKEYSGVMVFPNSTSITVTKPSWMTVVVDGTVATLSGVPPVGTEDFVVTAVAQGCNSSVAQSQTNIKVCEQVGAA